MKLADVMDEVADRLESISGLRVVAHPPGSVVSPAGVVSYPDRIEYQTTYGRGVNRIVGLPAILVVGKATDRAARDTVSGWSAGAGAGSVVQAIESATYASCDEVTVTMCTFDVVTIAGVDYLAAMFELDIIGSGA